jgi:hypothetical protein
VTDRNESLVVVVLCAESAGWRRRLGPRAWTALEHLALAANSDPQGWAAPVGV